MKQIFSFFIILVGISFNLVGSTIVGLTHNVVALEDGRAVKLKEQNAKGWKVGDTVEVYEDYYAHRYIKKFIRNYRTNESKFVESVKPYEITQFKYIAPFIVQMENGRTWITSYDERIRDWSVNDDYILIDSQNSIFFSNINSKELATPFRELPTDPFLRYAIQEIIANGNGYQITLENGTIWQTQHNEVSEWTKEDPVMLFILSANRQYFINLNNLTVALVELESIDQTKQDSYDPNYYFASHIKYPNPYNPKQPFHAGIMEATFNLHGAKVRFGRRDWSSDDTYRKVIAYWPKGTPIMVGWTFYWAGVSLDVVNYTIVNLDQLVKHQFQPVKPDEIKAQ